MVAAGTLCARKTSTLCAIRCVMPAGGISMRQRGCACRARTANAALIHWPAITLVFCGRRRHSSGALHAGGPSLLVSRCMSMNTAGGYVAPSMSGVAKLSCATPSTSARAARCPCRRGRLAAQRGLGNDASQLRTMDAVPGVQQCSCAAKLCEVFVMLGVSSASLAVQRRRLRQRQSNRHALPAARRGHRRPARRRAAGRRRPRHARWEWGGVGWGAHLR